MIRLLVIVLFLAFLIIFALSNNTDPVPVWLVVTVGGWKVSLGMLSLGLGVASLFLGLIIGWIGEFGQRRRARRAEQQVRSLEKRQAELLQRLGQMQAAQEHNTPINQQSPAHPTLDNTSGTAPV